MAAKKNMNWVGFALMTVAFWGLYGVFLHKGAMGMQDPQFGRYKAFLVVGIAYFLVAVLAPLILLKLNGADLKFRGEGFKWSLIAGTVGAIGALGVLLAFGKGGPPTAVMSIIFAGAPIVNAVVALRLNPPEGGMASIRWQFFAGILLAALGGYMVTKFKDPKPVAPIQSVKE
ncbi:MAG: drug/metabolite transporter (DMT)-like permease [Paracoccaceae bacterium]|jgi:drug/metabolite transporter (DMT)-like permease